MGIFLVCRLKFLRELLTSELRSAGYAGPIETLDFQTLRTRSFDQSPRVLFVATSALDSIETITRFRSTHPSTSVGVLAMNDHDGDFIAWAGVGIAGYMEPETSIEDIASILLRLAAGEVVCPPRLSGLLLNQFARRPSVVSARAGLNDLTHREHQVIELLAEGLSNKHIGRRLAITDATVKNHVHSILEKLTVGSRGEAAAYYRRSQQGSLPAYASMGQSPSDNLNGLWSTVISAAQATDLKPAPPR